MVASKSELINWINTSFDLNYTKVEQCGNGVAYCLIFNSLHPNIINLAKVVKQPKTEFQITNNFKLLQYGFNKVGINRNINVEKLMKCRLQDNLEFLQWFSRLWSESTGESRPSTRSSLTPRPSLTPARTTSRVSSSGRPSSTARPAAPVKTPARPSTTPSKPPQPQQPQQPAHPQHSQHHPQPPQPSQPQNHDLIEKLETLEKFKDGLEIERNFYFNKLRDIEILCQNLLQSKNSINLSANELVNDILEIMYATEDGFLPPDNEDTENDVEKTNLSIISNSPNSITSPVPINNSFMSNQSLENNDFLDDETF